MTQDLTDIVALNVVRLALCGLPHMIYAVGYPLSNLLLRTALGEVVVSMSVSG